MSRPAEKRGLMLFAAGVIVLFAVLFWLCYRFDNKYTFPCPQAQNGLLALDENQLRKTPAIFLTEGWEIYRDRLLSPADFAANAPPADEIVYLGQYGGFEGADLSRGAHGSATYRVNITLPPEPASYTLELPEIYSAYRLYINGILAEQFGDPGPGAYRAQTGNAAVSFLAKSRVEIIVAASDYSYMYSGMVYPPAFGVSGAVTQIVQTRFVLRAALCSVALAMAAFFLIAGIFMRKNGPMILYGLLCFCFVGYTCYPLVKTIFRGGMAWYGFENLCFCAMLLLVVLLHQRSGNGGRLSKAILAFGAAVCGCSVLRAALPGGSLRFLAAYSMLIGVYKWACAAFLTVSMAKSKGGKRALLAGILAFDCALVMDRLLPSFEPIRFGWFIEIAGSVLVFSIGVVLGQDIVRQYRERLELANSVRLAEMQIALQGEQFIGITQGIELTKAARHDLRHQLAAIRGYLASGDTDGARAYVDELSSSIPATFDQMLCENFAVNAVALHYLAAAQSEGVGASLKLIIPPQAGRIPDKDLCVIVGNLLENAIEACRYAEGERFIKLSSHIRHDYLSIAMDNSFDGTNAEKDGAYVSRKRGGGAGIGLASVKRLAEKYDGTASFETNGNVFLSSVVVRM